MPDYIISDIHGCSRTFRKLVEERIGLKKSDRLYLLGDYIDRGPDSKGVLDFVFELREDGYFVETLMGNHEEMLLRCFVEPEFRNVWAMNGGGMATLKSFETDNINLIPIKYIDLLRSLKRVISLDKYLLVHAGFNFALDNIFEDESAMVWIRNYDVDPEKTDYKIVIHGHTPKPLPQLLDIFNEREKRFEVVVDNGCVYTHIPGQGSLCALKLDDMSLLFEPNIDF